MCIICGFQWTKGTKLDTTLILYRIPKWKNISCSMKGVETNTDTQNSFIQIQLKKVDRSDELCIFFKTLKMLIHWKGPRAAPSDVLWIQRSNTSPLCSPTGALHGKTEQNFSMWPSPPPAAQAGIITSMMTGKSSYDGKRWGSQKVENVQEGGERVRKLEKFLLYLLRCWKTEWPVDFRR